MKSTRPTVDFKITSLSSEGKTLDEQALVLPKITSILPSHSIPFRSKWKHLRKISLADPDFGTPGSVDLLLVADIFSHRVLHGWWFVPSRAPSAFKTCLGWVLAGVVHVRQQPGQAGTCCVSSTVDHPLKRFLEIKYSNLQQSPLSLDKRTVVEHFHSSHSRDPDGRYIVPLLMNTDVKPFGESRSLAVRRFKAIERSLRARSQFDQFIVAMRAYFDMVM